jgi:hypothetical protein
MFVLNTPVIKIVDSSFSQIKARESFGGAVVFGEGCGFSIEGLLDYLSIYLSMYLSIYLFIYLFIYLSIYISIYLFIYLFINLFMDY